MKNITTPRTLAECSFTTGYSRASINRTGRTAERVMLWLAVTVLGGWALLHIAALIGG